MVPQLGYDSMYLLTGLPLAVVSFTLLVTGMSLGVGMLITVVGLPVLVLTLQLGRALAVVERQRVKLVTGVALSATYLPAGQEGGWLRRWWDRLRDTQTWLDTLHGILILPLATLTWSVAVTWYVGALAGLTFWAWEGALPPNDQASHSLTDVLTLPWDDSVTNLIMSVFFLVTLIPILRVCAFAQTSFAGILLGNRHVADLQERIALLIERRSVAATAEVDSLRRLERDLHDGPQQRLVRLGMDLATIERRLAVNDGAAAAEIVGEARVQTADALAELRALTRGIAPPILVDRGLEAALTALAGRSAVPTAVELTLPQRYVAPVETAAYFVASEALTNVAKHSDATSATLRAWTDGGRLAIEVIDDGQGGAALAKGHGLVGLADRVAALDGSLSVESPTGGPTIVRAVISCE